ncbi:hypothetical protein LSG31_10940 [Fodinisporobacter ferrooxydans]|uniref:Uncharacterized protein n=1 Tax=Fodinisporobacter ferrooxydans TaxID=2901836 RepID=A0ABY4CQ54_9BACL|nr:hypothetical protein LSG31_10940 [Alicyclobacillaceae bacterium MYW30-H2]
MSETNSGMRVFLAQPDLFVTDDQDFHTPEIKEQLVVLTPSDFLRAFGHDGKSH